jgi:signal transduction histidine kinase
VPAEPPSFPDPSPQGRAWALVLGDDARGLVARARSALAGAVPGAAVMSLVPGDAAGGRGSHDIGEGAPLLVVATAEVEDIGAAIGAEPVRALAGDAPCVVLTDRAAHADLAPVVAAGRLAAVVPAHEEAALTRELAGIALDRMEERGWSDGRRLLVLGGPAAASAAETDDLLRLDDPHALRRFLAGVERVVGPRPRVAVPAGTRLCEQGGEPPPLTLVMEGLVALHQDTAHGPVTLHQASTGRVIGLVSLVSGGQAWFTARTTTPCTLVMLSRAEIVTAVQADPGVSRDLALLAVRSLLTRLLRAEELHVDMRLLADELEVDRRSLADALEDLHTARAELVERTRLAMLGELSAGIAHELNNPVSALERAVEHLARDLVRLLGHAPGLGPAARAIRQSADAPALSTAAERALTSSFLPVTGGDRALARRLVRAGVPDAATAAELLALPESVRRDVLLGARIGSSLHSMESASHRIAGLASSLRSYARPEGEEPVPTDVLRSLDDALRLTEHRLRGIRVDRRLEQVPEVMARPGTLEQVWMNLLVNAADAIADEREDLAARQAWAQEAEEPALPARGTSPARVMVRAVRQSASDGRDMVVVAIEDNGPGVSPELQARMFRPHFTTRGGRVEFGLGMGLSIAQSIVTAAGGSITVESRPGCTRMRVALPVAPGEKGRER